MFNIIQKADRILGVLRLSFRSHSISAWCPNLIKDIMSLKQIKRRKQICAISLFYRLQKSIGFTKHSLLHQVIKVSNKLI